MKPLFFVVPGKPSAKKRPRFSRHSVYNSQKSVEDRFRWELKKQLPKGFAMLPRDTALSVECGFFLPIPKSVSKKQRSLMSDEKFWHTKKPDLDNHLKYVLDCMAAVVFCDDCSVVRISTVKKYSDAPRTEIVVRKV